MTELAPPTLVLGLNFATLRDLPKTHALASLSEGERYAAVRDAGFLLAQDADDKLASNSGLQSVGMGRIDSVGDAARMAREGLAKGYLCSTVHVGTGYESDTEANMLVEDILSASERLNFPLYVETHRATITQDP